MEINGKKLTDENIQKLWDFWFGKCTSICDCCEYYIPKYFKCSPSTCEYYEEYNEENKPTKKYNYTYLSVGTAPITHTIKSCQDLDFANCRALEGTVCKECNNNGMSHFSWNGKIVINKYD